MQQLKKTINVMYISLGSNIEPRFDNLKLSTKLICNIVGEIVAFSKVYETPSWGFESFPFLNGCIKIKTQLSTFEVLQELQKIEKNIGRAPKSSLIYDARVIDLDIIYSSEGIFNYPKLTVPHPLMQNRGFVLVPLLDIAPKIKHPLLHKTTFELLKACPDRSDVKVFKATFE